MKKITILSIAFSLALAGIVVAQQAEESPTKKGGRGEKATQPTETKPTRNATEKTTPETGGKQRGAKGERGVKSQTTTNAETSPGAGTNAAQQETGGKKGRTGRNATTNAAAETGASASPGATQPEQGRKGRQGRGANAATSATPTTRGAASATPATVRGSATPATSVAPGPSPATGATAAGANAGAQQGTVGRGGKKVEAQQVQQIKQQHANFRAQPKPNVAPAVTFDANRRIEGSQSWQGPQYEVFRGYHPEWHDQGWYRSHFGRVELIGGGWYYWNNGYWFPAWGYDPGVAYYPYDGPIYVGHRAEPPDRVIADVQAELQDMGYYQGEVDGLLGPLTRQALRDYQSEHGLAVTEAIDEPTLNALQLG